VHLARDVFHENHRAHGRFRSTEDSESAAALSAGAENFAPVTGPISRAFPLAAPGSRRLANRSTSPASWCPEKQTCLLKHKNNAYYFITLCDAIGGVGAS
jgi:hypothetical protein